VRITEILKKCVKDETTTTAEAMAILSAVVHSSSCGDANDRFIESIRKTIEDLVKTSK